MTAHAALLDFAVCGPTIDLNTDQVAADFGITRDAPELPNGVCADMTFTFRWSDEELLLNEDGFRVELTDEDGEPIAVDPRLLPLLRESLIARMHRKPKGESWTPYERLIDRALARAELARA